MSKALNNSLAAGGSSVLKQYKKEKRGAHKSETRINFSKYSEHCTLNEITFHWKTHCLLSLIHEVMLYLVNRTIHCWDNKGPK